MSAAAKFEIRPARQFTSRAVMIVSAFGLLLVIPVLLSILLVSSLHLGIWTALIPVIAICAATFLLPFGFGNTYVAKLARLSKPADWHDSDCFVVQISLIPRVRSGFRALMEDADDIGSLKLGSSELLFEGDSIRFSIPYDQLRDLRLQTIGLRGLFAYTSLAMSVSDLAGITDIRIAERGSCLLPTSRKTTRELLRVLSQSVLHARNLAGPSAD
jgi:hypothetical protein